MVQRPTSQDFPKGETFNKGDDIMRGTQGGPKCPTQ